MGERIGGYEIHPACAVLPMMPDEALREMAEDIRVHGQQQPVVLFEGKVLDGRNRLKACELAGVDPDIREWSGDDPVRWVLSLNFHRRHLSDSQKSVVGARAETLIAERAAAVDAPAEPEAPAEAAAPVEAAVADAEAAAEAPAPKKKKVQRVTPREIERRARQTAATLVNVSPRAIARGRKFIDKAAPELVDAVERGGVTLTQAARVAELDVEEQRQIASRGDDAVAEEARRIQKAKAARRGPSLAKALAELDERCPTLTVAKDTDGRWHVEGTAHDEHGERELDADAGTLKEAVTAAWEQLTAADGHAG